MASADVHSKAVVYLLLLLPLFASFYLLGSCFVLQHFVSFRVLQTSSEREREREREREKERASCFTVIVF